MSNKVPLRQWKKVYESDLAYIAFEMKETVDKPALIILSGEVGAGKTTFVKHFLGDMKATSPTYSIMNESGEAVYADFYRLEDTSDIPALELSLYLEGKNYFLVEWGEKYLRALTREMPEDFRLYILEILINPLTSGESATRDFLLSTIKPD